MKGTPSYKSSPLFFHEFGCQVLIKTFDFVTKLTKNLHIAPIGLVGIMTNSIHSISINILKNMQ